ncbi:MAG: MoxR family ATPase [Chromatiales bacterium]|nr:MoxR family ATPase [Chromatiales bacterium]
MTTPSPQALLQGLRDHLNQRIVGQDGLVLRLLIALLADGHLLVEGAPGLAKTRAIKALGELIEGDFHRIQFTPDLLPADVTGTEVYRPQDGSFQFRPGPIFHNLILADEINRAPAKVQSALLEAMAERPVTIGHDTRPLPRLFLVMATQNPIEQEGTYPLPEAQLDRFLMKLTIGYPSKDAERRILDLVHREASEEQPPAAAPRIAQETIFAARREMLALYLSDGLKDYIVDLVQATRDPAPYKAELERWVQFGASPRATIALDLCARAHAWLNGRDHVNPEDIKAVAADVLRHRVLLSFEAEAAGIRTDEFINTLLARVPLP